ncbi:S-4TM family putative pore-forming effector [Frankia sp. Mgl5]|uniref:S-4TM family putative pore-forming effector n=1 Tax=Frankia sp. Mgl5 TaxID=2933793 RepID=UPI0034D3DB30
MQGHGGSVLNTQNINEIQSKEDGVNTLCAAHVAHSRSQKAQAAQGGVAAFLALGSLASAAAHSLAPWLAIASFTWIGIVELWLSRYSKKWTNLATRMQERFDRDLFQLPWTADLGNRPTDGEVARLSSLFKGDRQSKVDWYVNVRDLPLPYAILICQRENLVWDELNRSRWASMLWRLTLAWCAGGVAVALAENWTTFHLLARWFAPSTAALWLCIRSAYKHNDIASTKQRLALSVSDKISEQFPDPPSPEQSRVLMTYCETVQRRIFSLRDHPERVPQKIYWKSRSQDETAARADSEQLRTRLLDL